ncbi:hypothetical protein EMCRGX_G027704 [Ephydatia muelleri]
MSEAGLFVVGKNTPLPLKDVSVKAHINGFLVGLDSTLKYSNAGADPIEVVFRFPLEDSFAVVGLEAVIDGRKVKAVIREKEEARQMYDDAIASGHSAALAEEKKGDIFSISLGNLPPQKDAELHLNRGVSDVTSPTHQLSKETRGEVIKASINEGQPLDKDLVVVVQYKSPYEPKAIVENGEKGADKESMMSGPVVMLNFFPQFKSSIAACEFIFLVDRSGSMGGEFIKSARETLILFLKSIPPGCSFNIIGFGSNYESLFPSSVPYNQENLDRAIQHAEHVEADLGGTELLPPLQFIFGQRLLEEACIQEVKRNVESARCFTFGIGSGVSTYLVNGLAQAGNGTAEFIQSGERLQPKVIRSLKQALQPSVTNLRVEFQLPAGFEVTQAASKAPVLFSGDKAVVYGILKGPSAAAPRNPHLLQSPVMVNKIWSAGGEERPGRERIERMLEKAVTLGIKKDRRDIRNLQKADANLGTVIEWLCHTSAVSTKFNLATPTPQRSALQQNNPYKELPWTSLPVPHEHTGQACKHETAGTTSFFLMFGRDPRLPEDVMYSLPVESYMSAHQYCRELKRQLQQAYGRGCHVNFTNPGKDLIR